MDIIQEVKNLKSENTKLSLLKDRLDISQKYMEEIETLIAKIKDELFPTFKIKIRNRTKRSSKIKEVLEECNTAIMNGTFITKSFLQTTYPDLEYYDYNNIMTRLKKLPGIDSTKDGKHIRLFKR